MATSLKSHSNLRVQLTANRNDIILTDILVDEFVNMIVDEFGNGYLI